MVSTKIIASTIPEIESKLKTFSGDMVKIEFLENCLKQIIPNDVKRFCYLKVSELYAGRLMYGSAAKNMGLAAECATNYKDKTNFYMKEITLWIKAGDYILIDKPFKKALANVNDKEKEDIKSFLKLQLMSHAEEFEKKNKRSNAAQVYEKILSFYDLVNETEKRHILEKIAQINSKLGKIREAMTYENILKQPAQKPKSPETNVRKVSYEDLGIEFY